MIASEGYYRFLLSACFGILCVDVVLGGGAFNAASKNNVVVYYVSNKSVFINAHEKHSDKFYKNI